MKNYNVNTRYNIFVLIVLSILFNYITFAKNSNPLVIPMTETKGDSITPNGYRYISPLERAKINAKIRKNSEQLYQDMEDGLIPVPGGAEDNWLEEENYSNPNDEVADGTSYTDEEIIKEEFIEEENQEIDKNTVASFSLSGRWIFNQHWGSNGFKGKMNLQHTQSSRFTGTATWDRLRNNGEKLHEDGTIDGQILGHNVEFTISYPWGSNVVYTGTLTQNGTKINGTAIRHDTGQTNTWDASLQTKEDIKDEEFQGNEFQTEIVCASAKPSITSGSEFKRAKFTIGGTEPQTIKITSSAENFAITKEYGGLVYQVIDGSSWGSTTLEPGSYILSCNGGGAMGLMSASVCIENPMAGQVSPPNIPPVTSRPGEDDRPTLEDNKPLLPRGPIEKIFVRPAGKDAKISSNHLTMLIRDEKDISVWGVDAGGKEQNVVIDDWKVYDDDIGWITEGLNNPVPKDSRVKIKFKAGNKKGYTRIKATVINKENRRISGVLSIEVTEDPPITVTGCVQLYDENGKPLNADGIVVELNIAWFKNRQAHDSAKEISVQPAGKVRTYGGGLLKFVVPTRGEFVAIVCTINSGYVASPPGYEWIEKNPPGDPDGNPSGHVEWRGSIKDNNLISMVSKHFGCLSLWLQKVPVTFSIEGNISYHGNPVENAKVRLISNGKTFVDDESNYDGEYWLDVGNLPKGKYKLTVKSQGIMTVHNSLCNIKDIWVDLPISGESKTIDIELISIKEKIGYTGP